MELHASMNIQQAIAATEKSLEQAQVYLGHGTDNIWDEAVYLTLGACGMPLDSTDEVFHQPLTALQLDTWQHWLQQRIEERVPLAYLLGHTYFAGIQLKVERGVIIPRSPIAELVTSDFQPFLKQNPKNCLDLCAGSGCIGIAIALHMQVPRVDLVDIDPQAIALAKENSQLYPMSGEVNVIASDLFENLQQDMRYDLIVSNPPYVDADDFAMKPPEFEHEPVLALMSGEDGLDITATILSNAADWLTDDGWLVVEVGNSEQALQQQLPTVPFLWIELEYGGNGVFALNAQQCKQWQSTFRAWQKGR